jgi:arylsulfatase B
MNIIFILLDDLGWNDVGTNNPEVYTPNICSLLNDQGGCSLNRNYTFTVCGPTRAMIQTGIYCHKSGINHLIPPWQYYGLNSSLKILPQFFPKHNSFAFGKWHLGHNHKKWLPHNRGYKLHYGNLTGCIDHVTHKNCPSKIHDFSCNGEPIYEKGHSCDLITNKTIKTIKENKNNEFLIYLAYNSPHVPLICPEKFKEKYNNIPEPRKSYLGMISHLDYNLGKIFQELKNLKIYDETFIWIQSDNGGWTPDWAGGNNFPFKGGKTSFYEGGVRSFSIIKHKNIKIKKFEGLSHSIDVLPTLLDFSENFSEDLISKEKIDGISIKNSLIEDKINKRDLILCFYSEKFWCFIFDNNYKFINENNKKYCYNLLTDPQEKNNIFDQEYENFKNKIEKTIKKCKEEFVDSPKMVEPENYVNKKYKNIKFWGQKMKTGVIKMQSFKNPNDYEDFLSLSGYDIFME